MLASRLGKLFPRDGHAGPDGSYRVTSLYFDTPYDTALREKLDGVDRREKFRLRYYGSARIFSSWRNTRSSVACAASGPPA